MKRKIALLTGGYTGESEVSLKTVVTVNANLDRDRFDVYVIYIFPDRWYYQDDAGNRYDIDRGDFSLMMNGNKLTFDGVFIAIHGSPGEDGKLQGYFDMLGLPYTTCDAITSSLTMNKAYTKAVVRGTPEIHMAESVLLFAEDAGNADKVKAKLKLPYFVKPNSGGSSIGMSKVKTDADIDEALVKAFNEDKQILVEEFVDGREFSVGVYRDTKGIHVLPATEVIPANEFFDYEAKYTPGATEEITPGRMTDEERSRVERIVADVYKQLNCRGVVRIDYFLERSTGNFYFIEINTIPGQTQTSFIPQQVAASGMKLQDFYTDLLKETVG